jgi:hypothetical protein
MDLSELVGIGRLGWWVYGRLRKYPPDRLDLLAACAVLVIVPFSIAATKDDPPAIQAGGVPVISTISFNATTSHS